MENQYLFKLIDNTYGVPEAVEILCSLIDDKVKFLNVKMLSMKERYGEDTTHMEGRVKQLLSCKENLLSMLNEAKSGNYEVEISSIVDVKLKALA